MDAITTAVDNTLYNNFVNAYNPLGSFYDKDYWDVFNKYFSEQLGTQWTTADPHYHMDAVREHYEECDVRDTLYVTDADGRKITAPDRQRELRTATVLIKHFTHLLPRLT